MSFLLSLIPNLISSVIGKGKGGSTHVQSVLFDSSKYSSVQARDWLKKHKVKPSKRGVLEGKYRHYRVKDPKHFDRIVRKSIGDGVILQLGVSNKGASRR